MQSYPVPRSAAYLLNYGTGKRAGHQNAVCRPRSFFGGDDHQRIFSCDGRDGAQRRKKMDDAFGTPKPADSPVNGENPDDGQTPEQEPKPAKFTAKKSKKRKPGTGCISKVSKNTWQGKYTPRSKDGKREQHIVYAKREEECERKLGEMIKEVQQQLKL